MAEKIEAHEQLYVAEGDITGKFQNKGLNPALSGHIFLYCANAAFIRMISAN